MRAQLVWTLLVSATLLGSWPATADEEEEAVIRVVAKIKTKAAEQTNVQSQMDTFTTQNESALKEHSVYAENYKDLERDKNRIKAESDRRTAAILAPAFAEVDTYNSQCAEVIVGKLPKGPYTRCVGEKSRVEGVLNAANKRAEQQEESARKEYERLENAQRRQQSRMETLNAQIKSRFNQWSALKQKSQENWRTLDALRTEAAHACAKFLSRPQYRVEKAVHCNSIGWDNTSRSLPALEDILGRF